MIRRLFEPFAQAPQTSDRGRGGLGLGLAMVKGLVELHRGKVTLSSEGLGRGTEVTVLLPLDGEAAQSAPAPAPSPALARRPRRVLIIEDNPDSADSLKEALQLYGHRVESASDGAQGLALAREFRPEVALCDIGLPGADGYQLARQFRADDALRRTYLVAVTGYAQPEDRQRAAAAGFDAHFAKPPDLDALERLLGQAPAGAGFE